jgi:uncharacterized protein
MKKDVLSWITIILVIIGAINWGLIGALQFDLVNTIFGSIAWLERVIYVLVGLAGLWEIVLLFK